MEFYDRANTCIKLGAPLVKITSLSIREGLSRLKSDVKNDEADGFAEFEHDMRSDLDVLERSYRSREVL
jgi:V/A-type H+-transporting ATPase subunit A